MADKEHVGIKGFQKSDFYEQVRPGYPREAVVTLMRSLGVLNEDASQKSAKKMTILELGAGTGKFTREMADVLKDTNVRIIASDPVAAMCDKFKEILPDIEIKEFPANNIALQDESVDAVVAANSFHWFAYSKESIAEISRILTPGGALGVTWSYVNGQSQPWIQKVWEYLDPFYRKSAPFGAMGLPLNQKNSLNQVTLSGKFGEFQNKAVNVSVEYNTESLFELFSSFSVLQTATPKEKSDFEVFYRNVIDENFVQTGKELKTVDRVVQMFWCTKL